MGAKKDYFHIWAHEFPVSKYPVNDFTKQLYTLRFKKNIFDTLLVLVIIISTLSVPIYINIISPFNPSQKYAASRLIMP